VVERKRKNNLSLANDNFSCENKRLRDLVADSDRPYPGFPMKDLIVLLINLMATLAKLMGPGGVKAVIADSLLLKQQLLVIDRSRQRAPNLSALDRFLLGFWSLFLSPHYILRAAVVIKPSTLLRFHEALKKRKHRRLFPP
jgi:putative transposase